MGRPKKSIEEHIANGTYRPGKHGPLPGGPAAESAEVEGVSPPILSAPVGLSEAAAAIWREIVPQLGDRAKPTDAWALADLCRWLVRMDRIAEKIDAMDPVTKGYKDLLISAGIASTNFDRIAAKFGLTFGDRRRLRVEKAESGPPKPKVATRPKTSMDSQGRPN